MFDRDQFDRKEQIRQAIDIVDLVGQYLPLRPQGRGYVALCPWHDDSRPSLQVNPERQSFKCWVCDIGGDIFSFVMRMESVSFPEALQILAEKAGITLAPTPRGQPEDQAAENPKQKLYKICAWAEEMFHNALLRADAAASARTYLQTRGIEKSQWTNFRVGFCPPDNNWLVRQAGPADWKPSQLEQAGLLARRDEQSSWYSRFRGRLMFPIHDAQARCVGFGGRMIPGTSFLPENVAKYVNSPESPIFSKSQLLYGLDRARQEILRTHSVVVTEGYTDVIVAHQTGFSQTVAVLGTALGPSHVRLLRRYAERVLLTMDGDAAGQRRTEEILRLFLSEPLDLRILALPEKLDPCEFMRERGAEAFRDLMEKAEDPLEFKLRMVDRGLGPEAGSHQISQAMDDVLGTFAQAPRPEGPAREMVKLREAAMLNQLSRRFDVAEDLLRQRLESLRRPVRKRAEDAPPPGQIDTKLHAWDRELLEILIQDPNTLSEIRTVVAVDQVGEGAAREIYQRLCGLADEGLDATLERAMLTSDEPELKSLLIELDETGQRKSADELSRRKEDTLASFRRRQEDQTREHIAHRLKQQELQESEEGLELFLELHAKKRRQHGISAPTDG